MKILISVEVMIEIRVLIFMSLESCHLSIFIMQTSHLNSHSLDHHGVVSCFSNLIYLSTRSMMTLQGNLQCFDKIGHFGVLVEMHGLWVNQLYVSLWFSKTLKFCVTAAMASVSRFEIIGDEYLHAALECREVILRVGWLGFLPRFYGFNIAASKAFAESFDGVNA